MKEHKMNKQIPEDRVIECFDHESSDPIITVQISDRLLSDEDQRLTNGEALRQRLSSVRDCHQEVEIDRVSDRHVTQMT